MGPVAIIAQEICFFMPMIGLGMVDRVMFVVSIVVKSQLMDQEQGALQRSRDACRDIEVIKTLLAPNRY